MSDTTVKPAAKRTWWAPVTDDTAEAVIKDTANTWLVVAALQALLMGFLVASGAFPSGDLADPVAAALGAYFLRTRRSRALAVLLLLLAIAEGTATVAAMAHLMTGGTNIFLAVIIVFASFRGVQATWRYQRLRGARTHWGRTIAFSVLALVLSFVVFAAVAVASVVLNQRGAHVDANLLNLLYAGALLLPASLSMALLTRKWPLATAPATKDLSQTFA